MKFCVNHLEYLKYLYKKIKIFVIVFLILIYNNNNKYILNNKINTPKYNFAQTCTNTSRAATLLHILLSPLTLFTYVAYGGDDSRYFEVRY